MQAAPACCCEKAEPSHNNTFFEFLNDKKTYEIATQVARFAIGVFGLIMSPVTFMLSFAAGTIAGALYYRHNKEMPEALETQPICARGYAEMLGQAKFPSIVNLGITSITIIACISCHTSFYAPFAGFFVGFYLGQKGSEHVSSVHNNSLPAFRPLIVDSGSV